MKALLATLVALVAAAAVASGAGAWSDGTATLTVRSSDYGAVLFDGKGKALYAFTRDTRGGKSRCYGACAAAWPVYYAPRGALKAGKNVKQSLIGTTKRSDGRLQVTYNGWPLYYYVHDVVVEIRCQNVDEFGGLWLVVKANGKPVPSRR